MCIKLIKRMKNIFGRKLGLYLPDKEITGKNGKKSLKVPLWSSDPKKRTQFVLHPLGGCPMGSDAKKGVVSGLGQVFIGRAGTNTYPELYVVDGSIIPGALGVNPSLTISALAYRIASNKVTNDAYLP
jgi:choline dehydrogenase-like flavoprotein